MQMAEYKFRPPKTSEEEETCVASAIPKSTQYKNKWAAGIFEVGAILGQKCKARLRPNQKTKSQSIRDNLI